MNTREWYEAKVLENADPEMRGRLRVACPAITDDDEALVEWIEPTFAMPGWFSVPAKGSIVRIEAVVDNSADEWRGTSFLQAPSYRWVATMHDTMMTVPAAFRTATYPSRMGYVSPSGLHVVFDDATSRVLLGSASASENLVLGQVFKAMMADLITALKALTVTCTITPPFTSSTPINFAAFEAIQATYLTSDAVLSDVAFTSKTKEG